MSRTILVWLAAAVIAAAPAAAQAPFHQDVVVTAAATPVELGTVTRTLTVITREQIAAIPASSIADVLRMVGAVDVRARGERGVQTDFSIRGATFGQTLVLVDGVRLNDAQSGHHNGDIPVPLGAVERIEVLHGPGSSLFGADAFGGTINIITRADAGPASARIEGGSFGLIAGSGHVGAARGSVRQSLAASVDRSSGFMFERGYAMANVRSRTAIGKASTVSVSYLWKDFGANGFYGNAPSHEWTNQTLVAADHRFAERAGWQLAGNASYRTHGDHFLFNVTTPGVAENRHRTHTALGTLKATRRVGGGTVVTAGVEAGEDWIRSTNLGNHELGRVSGFGEWRRAFGPRTQVDASLRVDRYTGFGTSVSPAAAVGWWASSRVHIRASAGRAFRVPTFTERYYQDPANWARPEVGPETSWAAETGADVTLPRGWTLGGTVFGRLDHDVIDWLRSSASERWRTYNIRDVDALGVELTARKAIGATGFVQASYTGIDLGAAAVTQLSKYVLDYAPHTLAAAAAIPLPSAVRLAPRVEYRHRSRSTGTSRYTLLDVALSRAFGLYEVRVDGRNLFDTSYQEILGVAMPGATVSVSLAATLGRR